MAYDYLEHDADVLIEGRGDTLEEAFSEGARALENLIVNLDRVVPVERSALFCEAATLPELLIEFLTHLLIEFDTTGRVFSQINIAPFEQTEQGYCLRASLWGEPLDPTRHELRVEVKAATYAGLEITRQDRTYIIRCVVDI